MRRQASRGSGGCCSALAAGQRRRESQRRQLSCQRRLMTVRRQAARVAAGREEVGQLGRRRLTVAPLSTPRWGGSCWLRQPSGTKPPCVQLQALTVQQSAGSRAGSLPHGLHLGKSRPPMRWRPLWRLGRRGRQDDRTRRWSMLALLRMRMTAAVVSVWMQPLAHRAWMLQWRRHQRRHWRGSLMCLRQAA